MPTTLSTWVLDELDVVAGDDRRTYAGSAR
jgi:hypothetical protein